MPTKYTNRPSSCHPDRVARSSNIDVCDPCYRKSIYWKDPQKVAAQKRARYHLQDPLKMKARNKRRTLKQYNGMTIAEYEAKIEEQEGRCPICGTTEPSAQHGQWAVDHNHTTNQTRGLLCVACNLIIGHFKEDPAIIQAAIGYLIKHAAPGR